MKMNYIFHEDGGRAQALVLNDEECLKFAANLGFEVLVAHCEEELPEDLGDEQRSRALNLLGSGHGVQIRSAFSERYQIERIVEPETHDSELALAIEFLKARPRTLFDTSLTRLTRRVQAEVPEDRRDRAFEEMRKLHLNLALAMGAVEVFDTIIDHRGIVVRHRDTHIGRTTMRLGPDELSRWLDRNADALAEAEVTLVHPEEGPFPRHVKLAADVWMEVRLHPRTREEERLVFCHFDSPLDETGWQLRQVPEDQESLVDGARFTG